MDKKNRADTETGSKIPAPAYPHKRREPLPWQQPKPIEEDPEAKRRIESILACPSYRQADEDIQFLNLDISRGVRLMLDYQKPESLLVKHSIEHTIVVFGSTRIVEPIAAKRKVDALRARVKSEPDNEEVKRRLLIAERILAKSHYYDVSRELGRLIGKAGEGSHDCRGESFWRKAFDIRFLVDEGVIDPEDEELFWFAETARDIWEGILSWYEANGTSFY